MSKKRILVVDDDPSLTRLLRVRLAQRDGYEVEIAATGHQATDIALSFSPDLVLLDWVLPGLSGLDVLRRLKCRQKSESCPVIMLTACNLIGDLERAFELGADGYLIKPVRLEILSRKVKEQLQQREDDQRNHTGWLSNLTKLV